MVNKTLYFGNPAYLSLRNGQLVVELPQVEKNESLYLPFKKEAERERTFPVFPGFVRMATASQRISGA